MKKAKTRLCSLTLSALMLAGCSNTNTPATQPTTAPATTAEPTTADPATKTTQPVVEDPTITTPTPTDPIRVEPSDPNMCKEVSLNYQYDNFTLEVLKRALAQEKDNVMVSPLSLMLALSMTANGAAGNTAQEMLSVLGSDLTMDQLNYVLNQYTSALPSSNEAMLSIANSIWYKDTPEFSIREDFLKKTQKYYSADIFPSAFDQEALTKINNWVSAKTDGMIDKILDELTPEMRMILINAILFDGKWAEEYYDDDIRVRPFTNAAGEKKEVEMMYSEENCYLSNDKCTGFMKYYKGSKYAFVGLLPNEGTPDQLIEGMTANDLLGLFKDPVHQKVSVLLPKFTFDYSKSMSDILKSMGMKEAFDDTKADFSNLSQTPLFISDVIHKTRVEVTEKGTRAAAVTAVIVAENCCEPEIIKSVYLDRPFVFMIVDAEQNLPIFIGRVNDLEAAETGSGGAPAPETSAPELDPSVDLSEFNNDALLLDILEGREIPRLVEYGYSGEAGYSLCAADERAIIDEFIEALREINVEDCISETEQIHYYADASSDVIFTLPDGRQARLSFDNLEYMYVGNTTYKISRSVRLSNICEIMEYVPFLAEIEDGYVAVLHGGAGERTYETYVYKTETGYKYFNVTSTTVSWGSTEWSHKVNDYGYTDSKEEILRRAKAHGADQCVTYGTDTTAYPIDDFLNSKEG